MQLCGGIPLLPFFPLDGGDSQSVGDEAAKKGPCVQDALQICST
jgi:hypothetical protein